jgi:hypothetical protein
MYSSKATFGLIELVGYRIIAALIANVELRLVDRAPRNPL